jgi:hypothetical protein
MMKHYIIPATIYNKLKSQQQQQVPQQSQPQQQPSIVIQERHEEQEEEEVAAAADFITDAFPKSTKGRASRLLQYIEKHKPKITWSKQNGNVTIDGNLIPDSNIIDLIRSAISGMVKKKPVGWHQFNEALKDINTPMALVSPSMPPGIPDIMTKKWLTH